MIFASQTRLWLEMNAHCRRTIVCDAGAFPPDVATIDTLARLQLTARRLGLDLRLRHASSELLDLLDFAGLCDVLRIETRRQPE
jgi:hypothetical protein